MSIRVEPVYTLECVIRIRGENRRELEVITIYTKSSSGSCRKAVKWLSEKRIPYRERRVFGEEPLTEEEIMSMFKLCRPEDICEIISTRSEMYKQVKSEMGDMCLKSELIPSISENPSLLKFPIAIQRNKLQVGFSDDKFGVFIPKIERRREVERLIAQLDLENER